MKNANDLMNEQFKQFADLQAKSMEQLLPFASLAANATSTLLSKNHEVMGDWVEFTAAQSQLPLNGDPVSDVAAAQMAAAKKLSETMSMRATEYAELAKSWGEQAQAATEQATAAVVGVTTTDSAKTAKAKAS